MSDWDRFSDFVVTLIAASLAWVSTAFAPDLPPDAVGSTGRQPPSANRHDQMFGWAQSVEEPPIVQVGEEPGEDVETLDEAAPPAEGVAPAESVAPAEDTETLDEGAPPVAEDEDIELLDQGTPPESIQAPPPEQPAPSAVTTVPVTTYVAPEPVAASGPVIPEGFGTGNVHVSTGSAGFPAGLADCHVGAVTGRAYVGIDCGNGTSVVGHAPSFEDFPFVVDEGFPFNRESNFTVPSEDVVTDVTDVEVLVARAAEGDDTGAPEIRATGASSVEFRQEVRDRKPRARPDSADSNQRTDSDNGGADDVSAAARDDSNDRATRDAIGKKRDGAKDRSGRAAAGDKEERSKPAKKQDNQKGKKGRDSKNRNR